MGITGEHHSHILVDIRVTVGIVHAEVIPNHITDALTEALLTTITPTPIIIAVTHHTENLHHIEAYQLTPETTAGPEHAHHTNPVRTTHLNLHPDLVE